MPKVICIILFLISYTSNIHCQRLRYNIELIEEEKGLSNSQITSYIQDKNGFLWLGTRNGAIRFDGDKSTIYRYNEKDTCSLLDNSGQYLTKDKANNIWFSYPVIGLSRYLEKYDCFDNSMLRDSNIFNGTIGKGIVKFLKDSILLSYGFGTGIYKYSIKSGKIVRLDFSKYISNKNSLIQDYSNSPCAIHEDEDGIIWILTRAGLFTYDISRDIIELKIENIKVFNKDDYTSFYHVLPYKNDKFIINLNNNRLIEYDKCTNKYRLLKITNKTFLDSVEYIHNIAAIGKDKLLLVGTPFRIATYDLVNETIHSFSEIKSNKKPLLCEYITGSIKITDSLFFASSEEGLIKINSTNEIFQFNNTRAHNIGAINSTIKNIIEIPEINSNLYTTIEPEQLILENKLTGIYALLKTNKCPLNTLHYNNQLKLFKDSKNRIWVFDNKFIYQYRIRSNSLQNIPYHFKDSQNKSAEIKSLIEDSRGKIWILTYQGGLHQFNFESGLLESKVNTELDSLSELNKINIVLNSKYNEFWILTKSKVYLYNLDFKTFTQVNDTLINNWKNNLIVSATIDKDSNIYINYFTLGILKIIRNNLKDFKISRIGIHEGLQDATISSIIVDHRNNLWMSTASKVIVYNQETNTFRIIKQEEGVPKFSFNLKFHKLNDTSIMVSNESDYCEINFENFDFKQDLSKLYIDKLKIFNYEKVNLILLDTFIHLLPNENYISFEYGTINLYSQENFTYSYKLDNWDHDWVNSGSRKYVSYSNLNPGYYTFMVKVAGPDGIFSKPLSVRLYIETVYYKRTWFIGMIGLLLFSLIISFYQWRIKQIRKTEELKNQFNTQLTELRMEALRSQMNPHFIFNSLNSINRYIIKSDVKSSSYYLTKFAKLMRLILDNSKNKYVQLSNELEALKIYLEIESMRFEQKFEYKINIHDGVEVDKIEIPPLIIQPYVENAIWHGLLPKDSPGILTLDIDRLDSTLIITLTDNGIGRQKSQEFKAEISSTRKSMGMKLTEERLKMASANILKTGSQEIIDLYDDLGNAAGTKVILKIPIYE